MFVCELGGGAKLEHDFTSNFYWLKLNPPPIPNIRRLLYLWMLNSILQIDFSLGTISVDFTDMEV